MSAFIRIKLFSSAYDSSIETFIKKVEAYYKFSLLDVVEEDIYNIKL